MGSFWNISEIWATCLCIYRIHPNSSFLTDINTEKCYPFCGYTAIPWGSSNPVLIIIRVLLVFSSACKSNGRDYLKKKILQSWPQRNHGTDTSCISHVMMILWCVSLQQVRLQTLIDLSVPTGDPWISCPHWQPLPFVAHNRELPPLPSVPPTCPLPISCPLSPLTSIPPICPLPIPCPFVTYLSHHDHVIHSIRPVEVSRDPVIGNTIHLAGGPIVNHIDLLSTIQGHLDYESGGEKRNALGSAQNIEIMMWIDSEDQNTAISSITWQNAERGGNLTCYTIHGIVQWICHFKKPRKRMHVKSHGLSTLQNLFISIWLVKMQDQVLVNENYQL